MSYEIILYITDTIPLSVQVNTWQVVGKKKKNKTKQTKQNKQTNKQKLDRGFIFQCCMHNRLDCICLIHPKGK